VSLLDSLNELLDGDGWEIGDLLFGVEPQGLEGMKVVSDEITDTTRWSVLKTAVFKFGDEYVAADYDVGATEYQDSSGEVTLYEVEPYEVTEVKYRIKK